MKQEKQYRFNRTRSWALIVGVLLGTFILHQGHAQQLKNSLLWEVKGKGIKTSYVYGTFHLLPQADFSLSEQVTNAFDASEQIVMELDMDNPNMQMELMQNLAMKDGMTIDQLMSEEDFKAVDAYITGKLGMGLKQMNTFKPFFIVSMLIPGMIEGTPASYEMTFVQRALDKEKEIYGLETPKEQAAVFDKIPYEMQAQQLIDVLEQEDEMAGLFRTMIETYKKEDMNEMYSLMLENMNDPSQEKYLLTDRNNNWIPKIGEFSKDKSTFYAVGAGHLGGEQGVINLLKKAGYKVKPVK